MTLLPFDTKVVTHCLSTVSAGLGVQDTLVMTSLWQLTSPLSAVTVVPPFEPVAVALFVVGKAVSLKASAVPVDLVQSPTPAPDPHFFDPPGLTVPQE